MKDFPIGSTLESCGDDGYAALAARWTEAQYPARSIILSADDVDDDDVFFILSGRARAATFTDHGKEVLFSELTPGESFGIFAAIDGQPRSTNVVALEESRIARMSGQAFRDVLYSHRSVTEAFFIYLVDRVRTLSARMTEVTTLNAEQRLISELLRLATVRRGGEAVVDPLPTQQELATVIFSQRESVGRDMSKLRELGLIERAGRTLVIRNLSALQDRLQGA